MITYQREKRLSICYLALKLGYINKTLAHTKSAAENSISIFSDYYKTVFSFLSLGNEKLLQSQRFTRR